jgi:gliding motility-associated-like protein
MKNRKNPFSLYALLAIGLCFIQQSAQAQLQAKFSANATGGCAPLVVQFSDESAGNPSSWQWDLGNGTVSLFQHPSTVYFTPGKYPVKLVIKNANGADSIVRQDFITVYANPAADFSVTDSVGCFPFKLSFTDKSIAPGATINKWEWDFGDGHTSTLQNPGHTYYNSGNYTVTQKITTDKGCTHTFSKDQYIRIASGVKSIFTDSSDKNCKAPATLYFTGNSSGPGTLSYSWDFGDGNRSNAQKPVHTYTTNGTYNVTLITTSNAGCSDTLRKTALVKLGTTVTQFALPDSICYGEIIPVKNTSSPLPATALWNFGDGTTSTAINPQKTYFTIGTFNIRLVNTYEKCVDSITKAVKVFSKPTASFTSDLQTFCGIPATVRFSGSGAGAAYRWEFGDGATANTRDAVHTYTAFGNYTVKFFVTGAGGCVDSVVKNNFISITRPQVQIPALPARGCVGLTVPFVAQPGAGINITSWHWDFGDGSTSTEATPVKTYNNEGTFTVKLIFTTESGCKDSVIMRDAVRASKKPVVNFAAAPTEACGANRIWFESTSVPTGTAWVWHTGDGAISTSQNFAYQYRDTGYFDVKLIVWNNECADSLVKKRLVHIDPPIARFRILSNCDDKYLRTYENFSIGAKSWLWEFGDGTTSSTDWSPAHRYAARGTYNVKLKVWNGSCVDSSMWHVTITDEKLDFNTSASEACKGTGVQFKALNYDSKYISTISWDFGDGQTDNQKAFVTYKYSKPGTYRVTLRYTDINGCNYVVSKDQAVRVYGPTASFTVQQQTICAGGTALFVDKSVSDGTHPITEWNWNYGDGSTGANASSPFTHNYADTGKYNVTLTVKDSYGCTNSLQKISAIIISKPFVDFSSPDTASCPGKPVSFSNFSSGSGLKYHWDFGDGNTSTKQSPVHTYNITGTYTVSLHVEDLYGCSGSITKQQYISISIPEAAFIVSDSISSCPPLQVQFTSQAKNYSTLKWQFGDGSESVLENPEHFYNMPGVYYVKQIIRGPGGCTDTAVKKMIVKGPMAVFSYAPLAGCKPLTVSMKASSNSGKVSFVWDFNDGTVIPGTDSSIKHTYTSAGNFIPKLILIDSTGCRVPVTGKDTLKVVGITARAAMNEYRVCNEGFVQFTDRSVANDHITGHHWDFGDGNTSTQANPRHYYKGVGNYTVKHTAITSLGCRDTTTLSDTVKVWAKPDITILGANAACEPAKLQFRPRVLAGDSAQFTWQWNFDNGATAQQAMPDSQQYKSAGNYTVQLQVAFNNYCRDTANHAVSINPIPKIDAGADTFVCRDKPVLLRATGADRYIWSAAPGLSCTDCATPLINPADNISYIVTGYTVHGCSSKDTINVRVRQPFTINVQRGDSLCQGESLAMRATGAELYEWFPADGLNNPYIANPKATPSATTTYTVVGRDSDHCFTDSAKVPVTVFPIPKVFAGNDTTVNTGSALQLRTINSPDINKWKWSPMNGLSCVDCAAPMASVRNTVTYRVDVSNAGGCKSFDEITVNAVCNGGNYFLPNTFSPNGDGSNDIFYVRGKGVNRIQSLKIFNRWGQMVFEKRDFMPNDAGAGWNGTFNGKRADMDVYIYIAEVICENSAIVALKGDVTLIR